jgi:hypothetical protein
MVRARQGSIVAMVVVAALLGGCTEQPAGDGPPADPGSVALRMTTATGGNKLAEDERTDVESAIGEVLSAYVVQAFLGDHPRTAYLQALDGFTDGAAELAARELEVLTASGVEELTAVRATRLDSDLSLYVVDGDALGATAVVDFDFDATLADESTQRLTLTGRMLLTRSRDGWEVFGYDVRSDDGAALGKDKS